VAVLILVENPDGAEIIWRYALVEVEVMFRYFSLLLSPSDQSIFHQVSEVSWPPPPRMLLALIWLGTWLGTAWKLARLDGAVTLGMFWFVLVLVPSSVLVLLNLGEPMAEHRVYLAAAGFFLASGTIVGHVWAFLDTRTPRSRLLLRFSLAAWLTVLGGLTVLRNDVWSDPVRLWLDAAEKAPDIWVPHVMLGAALQERGAREQAIVAYRRAIRLRPSEQTAYMRLGLTQAELGRLPDARATFQALLSLDPTSAVGHNGLGAVALLEHKPDQARRHYEDALAHHPNDVAARQSLAMLYETVWQNPGEALRLCAEVRAMAPRTPDIDACIARNRNALPTTAPAR
jgi:protein O-mannosyl-transferase